MPTSSWSMILTIKLTQQQKNKRKIQDFSLIVQCVYTMKDTGFKSLRRKNCSQEEGNWIWDMLANMLKWWGEGYYISATVYICCITSMRWRFQQAKAEGPNSFISAAQKGPIKWVGSSVLSMAATHSGGLFSISPLYKCWDSASNHSSLLKRGRNKLFKQRENSSFWCDRKL